MVVSSRLGRVTGGSTFGFDSDAFGEIEGGGEGGEEEVIVSDGIGFGIIVSA